MICPVCNGKGKEVVINIPWTSALQLVHECPLCKGHKDLAVAFRDHKVFSLSQVAALCGVEHRTVSKWYDSGRLRGYRLPGSQDRRVPREHLIRFMRENGISDEVLTS